MSLTIFQGVVLLIAVIFLSFVLLTFVIVFAAWAGEKISRLIARKKWEKWYRETYKEP